MPLPTNGYRQPVCICDEAGDTVDIVYDAINAVWRLCVNANIAGAGIVTNEPDDNDIAENLQTLVDIPLNYMHNPATNRWIRMEGGVDSVPTGGVPVQAQYIAGVARTALAVYADGDTCVPTFDGSGRLMVNSGSVTTVVDNDAVPAGVEQDTVIPLNYGYDSVAGFWKRLQVDSVDVVADERLMHLMTRSALMGLDVSAGLAGTRSVPIAADTVDAIPADERLEGIYSLAFMRALDTSQAAGAMGRALQARVIATSVDERLYELLVGARVIGTNTSAAAGSQGVPIEARVINSTQLTFTNLIGLFTRSQIFGADAYSPTTVMTTPCVTSIQSVGASWTELAPALGITQIRASGFAAARRGKRFVSANQTPGTDVTVPVVGAFDATKPLLMLRVDSASIRAIIRSLKVQLTNTPGSLVRLRLCLDTADRWSAGGSAVTPQNTNEESATAAVAKVYETPTASAAGGGTRYLHPEILNPVQGEEAEFDLEDGVLLGPTAATLLVYAWQASGTAGTLTWWMEHEEVS